MLIPVRIRTHNKQYGTVEQVHCPRCGSVAQFSKIKNKTTGTVLFLPVISWTNTCHVLCTACQAAYEVKKKDFGRIQSSQDVLQAIYDRHNELQEKKRQTTEKYSAGFSKKNTNVAMILAFLLTAYGVPFFYIGKPLYGILCLAASILSMVSGLLPLLFVIVFAGFVLTGLMAFGKIKDGKGLYLAPKLQKR